MGQDSFVLTTARWMRCHILTLTTCPGSMSSALHWLDTTHFFTVLVLAKGYWQIPLPQSPRKKIPITNSSHFCSACPEPQSPFKAGLKVEVELTANPKKCANGQRRAWKEKHLNFLKKSDYDGLDNWEPSQTYGWREVQYLGYRFEVRKCPHRQTKQQPPHPAHITRPKQR